jgi:hypothetical protein
MNFLKKYTFGKLFVLIFRLLLLTIILANIVYYHNWLNLFVAAVALFSTFIPDFLSERNILIIPSDIKLVIIIFIFASLYLGSLRSFYYRFWWWDLMLHTAAGLNLGFIGFFSLYFINRNKNIDLILSPLFIALFTFAFAVCLGTLWEIFEFSMDVIFGLNMQKSGLVDTMWDLIVDCIGSGIAAVISYIYLKKGLPSYFEKGIKKIFKKNVQFFEE